MKKGVARGFFLIIMLLSLLAQGVGCSKAKGLYHTVMPEKAFGLKKRVLLVPIMDQVGLGKEKAEALTSDLSAYLSKDGNLLLEKAVQPTLAARESRSAQFGIVIDAEQAKRAEEKGANVLITAVANPMEVHRKRTGIWPFRSVKQDVEISLAVNAFDVITGTLFLTHLESRTIRVPVFDEGEVGVVKPEIDQKKFDKALSQILQDQASTLGKALASKPWLGRILSAEPNRVVINAGQDVGCNPGLVFEVYGQGESIQSASGRVIDILGPKTGEIRIVEVQGNQAFAVPLEGAPIEPGQVIRVKR